MGDWSKLTVVKLKEELKRRGLPQAGLKAVLITRLDEDDATQPAAVEIQEQVELETENQRPSTTQVEADLASDGAEPEDLVAVDSAQAEDPSTQLPKDDADVVEQDVVMPDAAEDAKADKPSNVAQQALASPNVEDGEKQDVKLDAGAKLSAAPANATEEKEVKEPNGNATIKSTEGIVKLQDTEASKQKSEESDLDPDITTVATINDATVTQDHIQSASIPIQAADTQEEQQSPIIETADAPQPSTQTSVPPEEILEDSRKRKQRSHSPAPLTQDVALKKLKGEDGSAIATTGGGFVAAQPRHDVVADSQVDELAEAPAIAKPAAPDARFKGLFAQDAKPTATEIATINAVSDRDVEPAIHPATTALYVRNLMRPLQAAALEDHFASLSDPDDRKADEDRIAEFYLDSIKSHCLVQFKSVAAASRVRSALHNTVWPDEKSRKPLWVDFIPEEKLRTWVDVELDAAGSRPPKRWEVVYDNEDSKTVAYLQEASAGPRRVNTMDSQRSGVPSAPASAKIPSAPKGDPGKGFKALDDLFKSTAAKPKLYFQPVADSIAQKRLERLAQGHGGGRNDEMRRFTFEDEALLVDNGPEFRPGYRGGGAGTRGGRGGGFGGPRGGYRGGYDGWRRGR